MREKKRDDNYEIVLVRSDTYALDGEFTADQLATHSDARALRKAITVTISTIPNCSTN